MRRRSVSRARTGSRGASSGMSMPLRGSMIRIGSRERISDQSLLTHPGIQGCSGLSDDGSVALSVVVSGVLAGRDVASTTFRFSVPTRPCVTTMMTGLAARVTRAIRTQALVTGSREGVKRTARKATSQIAAMAIKTGRFLCLILISSRLSSRRRASSSNRKSVRRSMSRRIAAASFSSVADWFWKTFRIASTYRLSISPYCRMDWGGGRGPHQL